MLTKSAMRNRIKAITAGFRKTNEDIKIEQTEKSKEIVKLLTRLGYNDHNTDMVRLFEVISGESIIPFMQKTQAQIPKFAKPLVCLKIVKDLEGLAKKDMLIVLTRNSLSGFLKSDGKIVDMPLYSTEVTLATDEEIESLTDEQLDFLIKEYSA